MSIRYTILLLVVVIIFSCSSKDTAPQKPNILFILADDLGKHDLSCTGSQYYETPNIDKIANQGMVFNQGYAACRVCSPSRASIFTGMYTTNHGITDWIGAKSGTDWRKKNRQNILLPAEYTHQLKATFTTIPEALKKEGYSTFFAGKWHLGDEGSFPENHGFDINKGGYLSGSPKGGYFSPFNNPKLEDKEPGENLSMRLAKETATFINEHKNKPFFAFLSFYAVHGPIQTNNEKWNKYRLKAEKNGIADSGYEMEHFIPIRTKQDNPIYGGLVESMDDAVGIVLNSLKENNLENNTIVIFTSDNGGVASGDAFSTSNSPLRGGKGYQWEGGIREPFFINVPWMNLAGKENNFPVSGIDFLPTILEMVGSKTTTTQSIDGISLLPLIKGEKLSERPLFWHYPHYGNQGGEPSAIIRLGEWKLIHYYEDNHEELYKISTDINERKNLIETSPEIASKLSMKLNKWLDETGALIPELDPEYEVKKAEELLLKMQTKKLQALENQRMKFLSKDFDPNNNWWGSKTTED